MKQNSSVGFWEISGHSANQYRGIFRQTDEQPKKIES